MTQWQIAVEGHPSLPLQVPGSTLVVSSTHDRVLTCYGAQFLGFQGTCALHNLVHLTASEPYMAPHTEL